MRRWWSLLVALAVLAGVTAFAATRPEWPGSVDNGPLWLGDPQSWSTYGSTAEVGGVVIWGGLTLTNRGVEPRMLTRVVLNPAGDTSGVRVDAISLVDIEKHPGGLIGLARRLPPDYDRSENMRPVAGYIIVPRSGDPALHHGEYEVLVTVSVLRPGRWHFSSYTVSYQVGARHYLASHADGLLICAPMDADCDERPR